MHTSTIQNPSMLQSMLSAAERLDHASRESRECAAVVIALQQLPGATAPELAAHVGLDRGMVSRRLPMLARKSRVRRSSRIRRCQVTHGNLFAWWPW